jgi:hypothetical protein
VDNRQEAILYLAHLQAISGNQLANKDRYKQVEKAIIEANEKGEISINTNEYKKYVNQINELYNEIPTQYENPIYYKEITYCFNYLRDIIKIYNIKNISDEMPLYGTLNLNFFSASIRKIKIEPIIVFSNTSITFCEYISRVIAKMLGSSELLSIQQVSKNVIQNPLIIQCFLDIVYSYLNGTIAKSQSYLKLKLTENEQYSFILIRNYMLTYIVAHEYSHLLLGHLEDNKIVSLNVCDEKINFISNSWAQEFDADMNAWKILMHDKSDINRIIMGITLCFDVLCCLEELEKASYPENEVSIWGTHPPARERAYVIKTEMSKTNPNPVKLITICSQILMDNLVNFDSSISNYPSTYYDDLIKIIYNEYSPIVNNYIDEN